MRSAKKNSRLKSNLPPFSNLPTVCSSAISEIVNQAFQDEEVNNFNQTSELKHREAHLEVIAHYLNISSRGEVPSMSSITIDEKLFTFDLANFFLKKQGQPITKDEDYQGAEKLHYAKHYLCKVIGASDEFIKSFIEDKKIPITTAQELSEYKSYYKETSKQFMGKVSEFAVKCDYGKQAEFFNYFVEADTLKHKSTQDANLTFVEKVKSQSSLRDLRVGKWDGLFNNPQTTSGQKLDITGRKILVKTPNDADDRISQVNLTDFATICLDEDKQGVKEEDGLVRLINPVSKTIFTPKISPVSTRNAVPKILPTREIVSGNTALPRPLSISSFKKLAVSPKPELDDVKSENNRISPSEDIPSKVKSVPRTSPTKVAQASPVLVKPKINLNLTT